MLLLGDPAAQVRVADVHHGVTGRIEGQDDRAALWGQVTDEVEAGNVGLVALCDLWRFAIELDADS